jgi:hypothetical protein
VNGLAAAPLQRGQLRHLPGDQHVRLVSTSQFIAKISGQQVASPSCFWAINARDTAEMGIDLETSIDDERRCLLPRRPPFVRA